MVVHPSGGSRPPTRFASLPDPRVAPENEPGPHPARVQPVPDPCPALPRVWLQPCRVSGSGPAACWLRPCPGESYESRCSTGVRYRSRWTSPEPSTKRTSPGRKHGVPGIPHEKDAPLARRARTPSPSGLPEQRNTSTLTHEKQTGTVLQSPPLGRFNSRPLERRMVARSDVDNRGRAAR